MKRSVYLLVLMVLSSSAQAGEAFSFVVGGHRIRIEAPRNCRSASCVSVSIPGIYETPRKRERYDDRDADAPAPAPAPAAEPVVPRPVVPPARPAIETVAPAPPVVVAQAAPTPVPPKADIHPPAPPPAALPLRLPREPPDAAPSPASKMVSQISEVSHEPEDTPVGDWQTEGNKGSVRIEPCGPALCGYVLNRLSDTRGEAVLINMKPKAASEWSGTIYSLASGETYYATMAQLRPNSLKVEACALGRFLCSGNFWSRIGAKPDDLISSRQGFAEPRT